MAQWLITAAGAADPYADEEERWLREPVARQSGWVRATYDELRTCRLDDIRLPWATSR